MITIRQLSGKQFIFFLLGIMGVFTSSCGSASGVLIGPQQDFLLGGNGNDAFVVTVINEGDVPILLSEQLVYGETINLGMLTTGDRRRISFLEGSAAVFTNPMTDTAQVLLRTRGKTALAKGFQLH